MKALLISFTIGGAANGFYIISHEKILSSLSDFKGDYIRVLNMRSGQIFYFNGENGKSYSQKYEVTNNINSKSEEVEVSKSDVTIDEKYSLINVYYDVNVNYNQIKGKVIHKKIFAKIPIIFEYISNMKFFNNMPLMNEKYGEFTFCLYKGNIADNKSYPYYNVNYIVECQIENDFFDNFVNDGVKESIATFKISELQFQTIQTIYTHKDR